MENIIHPKRIAFVAPNVVRLEEAAPIDITSIGDHDVVVKNLVSTISPGTERSNIIGMRIGTNPIVFPRYSGYSDCVEIIAVGKEVKNLKPGDRAITIWGTHASYHVMKDDHLVKVPDAVSNGEAALSFIGTFPLAAVRKVRLEAGENCLVVGLGTLGQLAVAFARAAGAYPVIAVDMNADRREEALKNGADYALDPTDPDYRKKVISLVEDDGGVTTAIEVTGVGEALNQTLDVMARRGRVALLGCTRDSNFHVDFYGKVHTPGIELIGAHALARPDFESQPHYFTNRDDLRSIMKLVVGKRVDLKRMIKETHSPEECVKVYDRLVHDRNFPIVVQFDWSLLQ